MHIKPDFRDVKSLYFFISPYSFIFTSQLIIASITTNHSEQREKKKPYLKNYSSLNLL